MRRKRRTGSGVQVEKQQRFVRLIGQGVSNSEACRLVGINRRTGTRWRYGRTVLTSVGRRLHYPAVKITERRPRNPQYLQEHERIVIADLLAAKMSIREIARQLGRAPSTISREVRRNADEHGTYRPHRAEQLACSRLRRVRQRRLSCDGVLREHVTGLLGKRWSPEQVAHELRARFPGQRSRCLCTESIYQAIYDPQVELARPARRRRRRRRARADQRRARPNGMVMIDKRPAEAKDRVQAGHWEGDLIMGAGNRSAIGTLVERKTRFLVLLRLADGVVSAESVRDALGSVFGGLPAGLRRTLTWDQGTELAQHRQITATTGAPVFFCEAHSPWQRASNENMNGLLRDYFPKGSDLGVHDARELARIAAEVNERPRKTLGWTRPAELFAQELQAA